MSQTRTRLVTLTNKNKPTWDVLVTMGKFCFKICISINNFNTDI